MWERDINQSPLACAPTGDWACNPGMCPDQESNQQHFALWENAQLTEPHRSGIVSRFRSQTVEEDIFRDV